MKISMWNIYNELSYPEFDITVMIKNNTPAICHARMLISKQLKPDTVYIGKESDYFDSGKDRTLIVHQYDMLLVNGAEPEEVFDEVCDILEYFSDMDNQMKNAAYDRNGLQIILDIGSKLLKNPSFVYSADGKAIALTTVFPASLHWHWRELLENQGISEERFAYLKENLRLTDVFQDTVPVIRSHTSICDYLHCSLIINNYMVGHYVVFDLARKFMKGTEDIAQIVVHYLCQHIGIHFDQYNPTSRMGAAVISLLEHDDCKEDDYTLLLNTMRWDASDFYRILVIREMVEKENVLLYSLYKKVLTRFPSVICVIYGQKLVILENLRKGKQDQTPLEKELQHLIKNDFLCSLSSMFRGLKYSALYYRQADASLSCCPSRQAPVYDCGVHGYEYLIRTMCSDPLAETYIHRLLYELKEDSKENNTVYYQTLRAWCYADFHISSAAKKLGIHRNTLIYRLEQIREKYDISQIEQLQISQDQEKLNYLLLSFILLDNQ